jgi:hypothetical protein
VSFAAGSADGATTTVTITIINDALTEADEDIDLQLQNISGPATILATNEDHTVTITGATVSIAATTTPGTEPGGAGNDGQFTVTQTAVSGLDTVITYNVIGTATPGAGNDYTALSGTVTITAGSTTATIDVDVLDDAIVEGNETVIVQLTAIIASTSGISLAAAPNDTDTVTITDDDIALIEFRFASDNDAESSGGNIPQLIVNGVRRALMST